MNILETAGIRSIATVMPYSMVVYVKLYHKDQVRALNWGFGIYAPKKISSYSTAKKYLKRGCLIHLFEEKSSNVPGI